MIQRCSDDGVATIEPLPEAEASWAEELRSRAAALPQVDLKCPPNDLVAFTRTGYPGGGLKYGEVLRRWQLEGGFERDLRIESAPGRPDERG
jgi:hypothetical protein